VAALAGCFKDRGGGALCAGAECLTEVTTSSTGDAASTGTPPTTTTTGAYETTGVPVNPAITLRIETMAFIDPHLFISEEAMAADTDTEGTPASCVNDVTMLANSVLNGDLVDGKFNLLIQFADFGKVPELRLINGDCEPSAAPGGLRVCQASEAAPAVILQTEIIPAGACRELEPGAYQAINIPMINDPAPTCVRTKRSFFSLPVSDLVGTLDLREAQITAAVDDPVAPTKLLSGVVYGFLPMAAAVAIEIDAPLFGVTTLWSTIDAPACTLENPDYLPSVDMFEINNVLVPGAWLAINFTAEQVEFVP